LQAELFFCLGQKTGRAASAEPQATLGQLLHAFQSYADAEFEITRRYVDWAAVFWPHYYGCAAEPGGPSSAAMNQRPNFWRCMDSGISFAHASFSPTLEEVLTAVLWSC
jgi:hypothetical protein